MKLLTSISKITVIVASLIIAGFSAGPVQAVGGVIGRVSVVDDLGNTYGANNVTVNIHQSSGPEANLTTANSPANGQLVFSRYSDSGVCQDSTYQVDGNSQGYFNLPGGAWECLSPDPRGLECSDEDKFIRVSGIGDTGMQWNSRPGYWTYQTSNISGAGTGQSGISYFGDCSQVPDYKRNTCNSFCNGNPTCVMMGQHDNAWAGRVDYQYHLYAVRLSAGGTSCSANGLTSVTLHWQTNYDFAALRLYRFDSNDQNGILVADLPAARSGDYTVSGLPVNSSYNFYINAVAPDGKQTWSNAPYDSPVRVSTPSSCEVARPPWLSVFARENQPGVEQTPMLSFKPGNNGYDSFGPRRIQFQVNTTDSAAPQTKVKFLVSRVDGQPVGCSGGQAVTVNVPPGNGSPFAGESIQACQIGEMYPSITSSTINGNWYSYSTNWIPIGDSAGGWTPRDYYLWIEAQTDGQSQICSGALQYFPNLRVTIPVQLNGVTTYWCGVQSLLLVSNALSTGVGVAEQEGIQPTGIYGISGSGPEAYNPIKITPKLISSPYFESSSIALSGVAFIDKGQDLSPTTGHGEVIQALTLAADRPAKGFILVYTNRDVIVNTITGQTLQQGNYYIYANGSWTRLTPDIKESIGNDFQVQVNTGDGINFRALVWFLPSVGSTQWNVFDLIQNNLGAVEVNQRVCDNRTGDKTCL